jgi:conjugative transfer ATPase
VETPRQVQTLDADALDEPTESNGQAREVDDKRDVLGELEITARLMITGGEEREEARMTRADRSLLRHCILDAARHCVHEHRTVLSQDVRDTLRERSHDASIPEVRRARLLEMADAMDMFCTGVNGELFNRAGTAWPEADITIVDLATFAREGYNAELSIAYISLVNTINSLGERDQFLGRPTCFGVDEGHIVLKNPLLSPFSVKATKMWRKLGLWFWLSTQNLDDFPAAAQPMLNMIEWWICLSMPPDEVEKIARFRELTASQKRLLLSARKESGKFSEGVILSKSMELLIRAVLPSINLAQAMTDPEEKNARYKLMKQYGLSELDAALRIAQEIDLARGIEPLRLDDLFEGRAS